MPVGKTGIFFDTNFEYLVFNTNIMDELKFPVGAFDQREAPDSAQLEQWISTIERFPSDLEKALEQATSEALNWRYRPEGWTVNQVIHHCADSHMNAIVRIKLALTEEDPTIRPYLEARWAELSDSLSGDVSTALTTLKGLHDRWGLLLRSLDQTALERTYYHPEHGRSIPLYEAIGTYDWHCRHHLAHIVNGLNSEGRYN